MSKLVYVAGPYTNPDPIEMTHNAVIFADDLYEMSGHFLVPIVPHTTLAWHLVRPHSDVTFWYDYDLEVMKRCDVVARIPGVSSGADREVDVAQQHNIPAVIGETVEHVLSMTLSWGRWIQNREGI